jgi:hypothetical protein
MTRAQLVWRLRQLPRSQTRTVIAAAEASYDTPTAKENMPGWTRHRCEHQVFSPSSLEAEVAMSPPHDQGGLRCRPMMPVGTPHHGGFQRCNHIKEALCPHRGWVVPLQGPPPSPSKAHVVSLPRGHQICLLSTKWVPAPRRRIDNHHPTTTTAGGRIHSHQRSSPKLPTAQEEYQRDQIPGSRQRRPNLATAATPVLGQTLTNPTLAPPNLVATGPHHAAPSGTPTQSRPLLPGGRKCWARPSRASLHDSPQRRAHHRTSRRARGRHCHWPPPGLTQTLHLSPPNRTWGTWRRDGPAATFIGVWPH